jgi:hypothetical protein
MGVALALTKKTRKGGQNVWLAHQTRRNRTGQGAIAMITAGGQKEVASAPTVDRLAHKASKHCVWKRASRYRVEATKTSVAAIDVVKAISLVE